MEISGVCANAESEEAMCKVKVSDGNSFIGDIFNWNDGDKICHNFKDEGWLIKKMFIYFTMVGPGNKGHEKCVKEKKTANSQGCLEQSAVRHE